MSLQTNHNAQALLELAQVFLEIPFNRMLGLRLDEMEQSHVAMSFDMKNELIGNFLHGILHGGVTSSVLDMAGGMAAMSSLIYKQAEKPIDEIAKMIGKTSTIDMHVNYIRPGRGSHFIAKASVINTGNKISFTRMELFNQDAVLIATGTGTYLVG
jgi:uncharacterized protein (TIGR00369 family)